MTRVGAETPTLFFDLDGTLADPREGMTKCLLHALQRLGRLAPAPEALLQYIGPSLRSAFPRLLESDDPGLIEAAVRYYRERYSTVGLFEQDIYPGIPLLLQTLHGDSFNLFVVTSKPQIFAQKILDHFRLAEYFADVFGPQLDGRFDDKTELIAHIFEQTTCQPRQAVMIGDRASDILAGKTNGTRTIAVTYGFGSAEELAGAEPDQICHSPAAIRDAVLQAFPTL
ncbi:MAG: HAD hydrolase-like protein [Sedimentisphaerales bacterium]|nr:HAD hydrolase-like protein [Sedimentisphaerales bacterium]